MNTTTLRDRSPLAAFVFTFGVLLSTMRVDYFVARHRHEHPGREWYELQLSENPRPSPVIRELWRPRDGQRWLPIG